MRDAKGMREVTDQSHEFFLARLGGYIAEHADDWQDVPLEEMDRVTKELVSEAQTIIFEWESGRSLCQSPIEERLFAALLVSTDGYRRIRFDEMALKYPPDEGTVFIPQFKFLSYAVDFMVVNYVNKVPAFSIAIECDGHDFHERTKEQARHDKSRDRAMAAHGLTVLRFTGSEIFRDAQKCCAEIESIVFSRIEAPRTVPQQAPTA